ncbi:uncharacterized protein LOC118751769 [Rhagoletis pomonella]|uniref:uncharacterized protein LOC118751769 n=1 Tax=Rhagoletis pomonella TaxID=28610 RepID=UPI001784D345|nr:uncharacterized protein LOC118751769 [Rhagoletis pomonella]
MADDVGNQFAISTIFGWVITSINSVGEISSTSSHITVSDVDHTLRKFWEIEESKPPLPMESDDLLVEEHFQSTVCRQTDGKYSVDLPFKGKPPHFSNTSQGAVSGFHAVERRLLKNTPLRHQYIQFMRQYEALGQMQAIEECHGISNDGHVFYLPHHPVLGKKLTVVFDGSYADTMGVSLNSSLHAGPNIQRNLFAVCLRFRFHQFVFTADTVKMFRQIWISEYHRDIQRIIWRESPDLPLKHYRLNSVTYGNACAPFLAVSVLQQLAHDSKEQFPRASSILLEDFYVDDVLTGAASETELVERRDELVQLFKSGGMELSKWVSNSTQITSYQSVHHEMFSEETTKGWDDPLPTHLAKLWAAYQEDIHHVRDLTIARFVPNSATEWELHAFSGASLKAYAAAVYCRFVNDTGQSNVSLIAAKTRVAPLKTVCLPRLELCGALLLTCLVKVILDSMPHRTIRIYAWCDSMIVMSWLSIPPVRLKTFVANRTSEILDTLPRNVWHNVASKDNPADCASRGMSAAALTNFELWWKGPNPNVTNEVKGTTVTMVSMNENDILNTLIERVSSWQRLLRTLSYVHRFIDRLRKRAPHTTSISLTFDEIDNARNVLLRHAQACFKDDIESLKCQQNIINRSRIIKLTPFLDDKNLFRVGGRISNSDLDMEAQASDQST